MLEKLDNGIFCIDTGYTRPGLAACYLVIDDGEAALVETGTANSVPRILQALGSAGVAPSAVRYVIPTHVHLDHAGAAGALLGHLPEAIVLAHPRGARHLLDPSRLIAGATDIYGRERFRRLYGDVVAVPPDRLLEAEDGSAWRLGRRELLVRDTPGHARHHFCVWDERSSGWFTGDTFGAAYRELRGPSGPVPIPTTTPVQFDPESLHRSMDLLMEQRPRSMYLTHYGAMAASKSIAAQLHEQIDDYVSMATALRDAGELNQQRLARRLAEYTLHRLRADGCRWRAASVERFLALDLELNAAGLVSWLEARR